MQGEGCTKRAKGNVSLVNDMIRDLWKIYGLETQEENSRKKNYPPEQSLRRNLYLIDVTRFTPSEKDPGRIWHVYDFSIKGSSYSKTHKSNTAHWLIVFTNGENWNMQCQRVWSIYLVSLSSGEIGLEGCIKWLFTKYAHMQKLVKVYLMERRFLKSSKLHASECNAATSHDKVTSILNLIWDATD